MVHGSGGSSNTQGPPDVGSSVAVGPVQCTGCINVLSSLIAGCTDDRLLPHLPVSHSAIVLVVQQACVISRCIYSHFNVLS